MPKTAHKVVVIGHRNPDTDSICSAIAYAELKNKTSSLVCEARRAGRMNQETEFVLKRFGVAPPRMCTDVNPKIRDVDYREMPGIPGSTSLRKAWEIMRDQQIDTLPITSADNELEGIITVKDIATANMDVFDTGVLATSRTTYKNILETLGGTMVVGNENAVCTTGHIKIGTATPEMLENNVEKGDIVILTNRYESQLCAIEKEASLLIICNGAKVGRTIQRIAEETGVAIMTAPCDTYAAGKLMSQCAPISYYMTRDDIMKFTLVTPVADVTRVMAKVRHRYFPILDEDGKYCGMVSRRNIIALRKRRIILVDHNEATQAVEGFDQAEILEIIDHHRIGSLETSGPVYFRNQPVGCTATIITQMYDENGVEIRPQIAGLLLAAILSDTLVFRSPTCTPVDVSIANRLAKIAGVEIDAFASEMFEAGEKLDGKTPEEVFLQDFKVFMCGDVRFGVAQGSYMTRKNLKAAQKLLTPYLPEACGKQNVEDLYMLLTDVPKEESVVICTGRHADEMLRSGFEKEPEEDGSWVLPGVVSRKKQFIPALMSAYQEL
ncbi:putative manganese-dependent inorganic diphosphatase [Faecalibacterium longum]|uniref:putative manganese-dependent inorganic diphosphatase n=1 Tax=Faecalibacterium longum TaxID=1851428 RepID=UPI001D0F1525|nr:putative manganese-dependent inorganic diphosphatase [Faecalibacterium longum]MCC2142661.1 putative manganese-dependent inorganic diphosphatase [Faecalibacterium longum CLA-AA-H243]